MKTFFEIRQDALAGCDAEKAQVVVYSVPLETEKQELIETLGLDRHDLESALDPEEISRVDFTPDYCYIIWKRPNNVSFAQELKFEVSSVGLFLQKDRLTVILGEDSDPFSGRECQKVGSLNGLILKFLLQTVHHYFGHLKAVKMMNAELQTKLSRSMENRYFLQMFALSESLIYYLNAIEGNAAMLSKLRMNAGKMGLNEDELGMLDDIIIEHQQCLRQTQIYSSVLSGMMDARGNIVNNNMNVLLKNLTLINVVFLPLNLIAGIGGMSEFSRMTEGVDWRISYALFAVAMIVLGWLTWKVLVRKIDKRADHKKNLHP